MACRPATLEDGPAIARIGVAAWKIGYADILSPEYLATWREDDLLARWTRGFLADPSVLVAESDGRVVGFSRHGPPRDDDVGAGTGEIISLNVDPAHWRGGHGAALLTAGVDRLRERGYTRAVLWVLRDNVRGRRFYESQGWRPDGTERRCALVPDAIALEVRYERALQVGRPGDRLFV
ncbi:MAG: GNAT family N-acetyltransferase [bacterium]